MNDFAKYYDDIYHDKKYDKETRFLIRIFKQFGLKNTKKILDLACGTGTHSIELAKKKFEISGIDFSQTAINLANRKINNPKLKVVFTQDDMRTFCIPDKFDACISMFGGMCYLTNKTSLVKTLKNIANHLKPGGLFIFDFWNGNAVLHQKPSTVVKTISLKNKRIIRIATPNVDLKKHTCDIDYHCLVLNKKNILDEFSEIHKIKYFFLEELKNILDKNGFSTIKIVSNSDYNLNPKNKIFSKSWYLTIIAKRN